MPGNTYITGGRPYGQNTTLGTDESNTITLNIFTKTGVESLNGASIYGDGGTNAAYTKNGKITMNIQAAGSSIEIYMRHSIPISVAEKSYVMLPQMFKVQLVLTVYPVVHQQIISLMQL